MLNTTTLRLGGVPEHFNLPMHQAKERGEFLERGINLEWTTFAGGTGQMCKALRENKIDACILLTEGIIADIINGNESKIISQYIKTPLNWGVHTGAKNKLSSYKEIFDKKYAISRFGSGSHLMAIVDANRKGQDIKKEQFKVIGKLDGALQSLQQLEADVFYWEKYTTKPYVDNGSLKRLGEYLTPWPCFMIAATDKIIKEKPDELTRMLRTIHDSADKFMHDKNSISLVSERFHQKSTDVARWFHSTEWAIHGWVSDKMVNSIIYNLKVAEIISKEAEVPEIIWKR